MIPAALKILGRRLVVCNRCQQSDQMLLPLLLVNLFRDYLCGTHGGLRAIQSDNHYWAQMCSADVKVVDG